MLHVQPKSEQIWKDFQRWVSKHHQDFVNSIQSNLNYTVWYDLKDKDFFSTTDTGNIVRDFKHNTIKVFSNDNNSYWEPSISYKDYFNNLKMAYEKGYMSLCMSLIDLNFANTNLDGQEFENMLENFDYNNTNINKTVENFIDKNKTEFDTANLHIILDEAPKSYFDNGLKDQQIDIIKGQLKGDSNV